MEVKNGVLVKVDDDDIDENGYFDSFDGIKAIEEYAFSHCEKLTNIFIPSGITSIGKGAFYACPNLTRVSIYADISELEEDTFAYCRLLNKIDLNDSITTIGNNCFMECENLSSVYLPLNLKKIGDSVFEDCEILENIYIPDSLEEIGERTFKNCVSLREINLNCKIEYLGREDFENCLNLEFVNFPKNLQSINEGAFLNCELLSELDFPESLEYIGYNAFSGSGLGNITFKGKKCEADNEAFSDCENLKTIVLYDKCNFNSDVFSNCERLENVTTQYGRFNIKEISKNLYGNNKSEIISLLSKVNYNSNIKWPLHLLNSLDDETLKKVLSKKATKYFKEIYEAYKNKFEHMSIEDTNCLYKFAIYLGCFDNEICLINGRETNVAQKTCDFLKRVLDSEIIRAGEFRYCFDKLVIKKYNPDFINFVTQREKADGEDFYPNFEYLISYRSYMSNILNDFEKINKKKIIVNGMGRTNSNPTTKNKIESYIMYPTYSSIEKEDKELAEKLSLIMNVKKDHFENAKKIIKKGKDSKSHILNDELKQDIEELKNKIEREISDSKVNLDRVFDKEFAYEWLDKHDIDNLILGAYCDCCATITSLVDYGKKILEMSMTNDNIQNLVIRNLNNEIIAKATIYVNKKYGYAVFNDIEVNTKYGNERFENAKKDDGTRERIYKTFKKGVYDFVEKYNKENKVPITQVNIGWENNKLKQTIKKLEEKSDSLLNVPDYFKDAKKEQWIVYKKK